MKNFRHFRTGELNRVTDPVQFMSQGNRRTSVASAPANVAVPAPRRRRRRSHSVVETGSWFPSDQQIAEFCQRQTAKAVLQRSAEHAATVRATVPITMPAMHAGQSTKKLVKRHCAPLD